SHRARRVRGAAGRPRRGMVRRTGRRLARLDRGGRVVRHAVIPHDGALGAAGDERVSVRVQPAAAAAARRLRGADAAPSGSPRKPPARVPVERDDVDARPDDRVAGVPARHRPAVLGCPAAGLPERKLLLAAVERLLRTITAAYTTELTASTTMPIASCAR